MKPYHQVLELNEQWGLELTLEEIGRKAASFRLLLGRGRSKSKEQTRNLLLYSWIHRDFSDQFLLTVSGAAKRACASHFRFWKVDARTRARAILLWNVTTAERASETPMLFFSCCVLLGRSVEDWKNMGIGNIVHNNNIVGRECGKISAYDGMSGMKWRWYEWMKW